MPKMYSRKNLPPCPDPDKYILVTVDKLYNWRRKRGTVKKAELNKSFQQNANNTSLTNNAAKEIIQKLQPFLYQFPKENRNAYIAGRLKKGLNATGMLEYTELKGYELQAKHPLKSMMKANFHFSVANDMVSVSITLDQFSVKPLNTLVTQYFFEIILLHGELLGQHGLRVETDTSELFNFYEVFNQELTLSLLLPESVPWMLILKLSCLEGKERALHAKHHVMRVVGTGRNRIEQRERVLMLAGK